MTQIHAGCCGSQRAARRYGLCMATAGVWGLGAMGRPILENLAKTQDAVGYDREQGRMDAVVGARLVSSIDELIDAADVVIVVLPGADAARRALLPGSGVGPIRMMRRGALLLELTSGDPRLSADVAGVAREAGVAYVAAPMAGGPADAQSRSLGFYVAGAPDAVAAALPWLQRLGAPEDIRVVGTEPAQAHTVKLAVNAVWFGQAALVSEALLFAAKAGVDPARMQRILDVSAAASAFTHDYVPRLLDGDSVTSFGLDGIIEELQTVVDVARTNHIPVRTVEHVMSMHREAREEFGSVKGELIVARLLEKRAGVSLRRPRD